MSFHFKVNGRLGKGSYSFVYSGIDELGNDVAIKKERFEVTQSFSVEWEHQVMTAACEKEQENSQKLPPIPYPLIYGLSNGKRSLVMPKLGDSVGKLQLKARFCRFSYVTTFKVAYFMIQALEATHNAGYIHADLKPENLLSGLSPNEGKIFLSDYGLSKRFKDRNNGFLPEIKDGMIGTVAFTSAKALKTITPGPREDLESLGYVLIYILTHNLPWTERYSSGVYFSAADIEMRKIERRKELCKGISVLYQYFQIIDVIRWGSMPNYELLKNLFTEALAQFNSSISEPIEWYGPMNEADGYLKNREGTSEPYREEQFGSDTNLDQWEDEDLADIMKNGLQLEPPHEK